MPQASEPIVISFTNLWAFCEHYEATTAIYAANQRLFWANHHFFSARRNFCNLKEANQRYNSCGLKYSRIESRLYRAWSVEQAPVPGRRRSLLHLRMFGLSNAVPPSHPPPRAHR